MAQIKKGRGWRGDTEGHRKAGEKGGNTTYDEYGAVFYQQIGRLGGQSRKNDKIRR